MTTFVINASGEDGIDGSGWTSKTKNNWNGRNGAHGSGYGGHGSPGGRGANGNNGTVGKDGKDIDVNLTANNDNIVIFYRNPQSNQKLLPLENQNSNLVLTSNGGHGGHGGNAGYGGRGGNGASGKNADKYTRGGDGGNGGRGGDGGNGGHSADGGKGGNISVVISKNDMDLLMILPEKPCTLGGQPGRKGLGGGGGNGGRGGSGGNSYHWTTTIDRSYTNAEGVTIYDTETKHHSTPGGHSGRGGAGGNRGNDGGTSNKGSDGSFTITIKDGNNSLLYPWRYDLKWIKARYCPQHNSNIFEPGCGIELTNFYNNFGQCPTPYCQKVFCFVAKNDWIIQCTQEPLPFYVHPNDNTNNENPMKLLLKESNYIAQGDPYITKSIMQHRAVVDRVYKPFPFVNSCYTEFTIRYPVLIEPIKCNTSICLGEEASVIIKVTNISSMHLGKDSKTGRVLRVKLRMADVSQIDEKNIIPWNQVIIRTEDGNIVKTNDHIFEICNLLPNSSLLLRFTLEFTSSAIPYFHSAITSTLELGNIKDYSQYKPIQERTFFIQLAEVYKFDPNSNTLLIVNNMVERETIVSWQQKILSIYGTPVVIYNISLYRGIDIFHKYNGNNNIIDDIAKGRKGVIIFLNNRCRRNDSQEKIYPYHELCSLYPLELIKKYAIHLYIIGDIGLVYSNPTLPLAELDSKNSNLSLVYKSKKSFYRTGLDRVSYHLYQTKEIESKSYSSLPSLTSKSLSRSLSFRRTRRIPYHSASNLLGFKQIEANKEEDESKNEEAEAENSDELESEEESESEDESGTFVSIQPEISICKSASMGGDFYSTLLKKRKENEKLKRLSGWKRVFVVLRIEEATLSWYYSKIDTSPIGVLDVSENFDYKQLESKKNLRFEVKNNTRGLIFKTSSQEKFDNWKSNFEKMKISNDNKQKAIENEHEHEKILLKRPSESAIIIPSLKSNSLSDVKRSFGANNVFFGWVKKLCKLNIFKKRFLRLDLISNTLTIYGDCFSKVKDILSCENITASGKWDEEMKETSKYNENLQLSIKTPLKQFYFLCNMEDSTSRDMWLKNLQNMKEYLQEQNEQLSSSYHINSIPETRAVIPVYKNMIRFQNSNFKQLRDEAKEFGKKLQKKYPEKSFYIVYKFEPKNQFKTGILIPKCFIGTLNIFESIPRVNSGLQIHYIDQTQINSKNFILSLENEYYLYLTSTFIFRIEKIKKIKELSLSLLTSIVSTLVNEFSIYFSSNIPISSKYCGLLNLFIQYDWLSDISDISQQNLIRLQLVTIIGDLNAAFKCTKLFSVQKWGKKSAITFVKNRLKFLFSSITQDLSDEDKIKAKDDLKTIIKQRKKQFTKKGSVSKSLIELQYPFLSFEEFTNSYESNYIQPITVLSEKEFREMVIAQKQKPGRRCKVKTSLVKISSNEERINLLDEFEKIHF